jgi:hypothetical protein
LGQSAANTTKQATTWTSLASGRYAKRINNKMSSLLALSTQECQKYTMKNKQCQEFHPLKIYKGAFQPIIAWAQKCTLFPQYLPKPKN